MKTRPDLHCEGRIGSLVGRKLPDDIDFGDALVLVVFDLDTAHFKVSRRNPKVPWSMEDALKELQGKEYGWTKTWENVFESPLCSELRMDQVISILGSKLVTLV